MLRRVAHPLLAAVFVVDGIDTLTSPEPRAKAATELVHRGEKRLPPKLAAYLPDDPLLAVRINAAVRIGGGALLALGKLPRLSAVVLAATIIPSALTEDDYWSEQSPERRAAKRTSLLKDASLLGGLLIASTDREGRPSLGWRGRRAVSRLRNESTPPRERFADIADFAKDHGPELGSALRDQGGKLVEVTRDLGAQVGTVAADRGGKLLDAALERGSQFAEVARERGGQVAEIARERSEQLAEVARERSEQLAEAARERGEQLADVARERGEQLADATREATRDAASRVR
ncbi:DoxX family membrane protein [Nocardia sp. NPDC088792]|uniref:DoxX family membrane protein n=1 Tax=Nocardia sp. NPDC088792 TaxID=3364332 RepID=UPI00381C5109